MLILIVCHDGNVSCSPICYRPTNKDWVNYSNNPTVVNFHSQQHDNLAKVLKKDFVKVVKPVDKFTLWVFLVVNSKSSLKLPNPSIRHDKNSRTSVFKKFYSRLTEVSS